MAWGDSWGHSPWDYHKRLAKAFFEGREAYGSKNTYVKFHEWLYTLEYWYNGGVIATWLPESGRALRVAHFLAEGTEPWLHVGSSFDVPAFRCYNADKGEMRHLKALGVDAVWQYDKQPFLIEGANAVSKGFMTLDEWRDEPKWKKSEPPPKPVWYPRREQFENRTLPLPGFA